MSDTIALIRIHDLDLMLNEVGSTLALAKLKRLGFPLGPAGPVEAERQQLLAGLDPRWLSHYERARRRYGTAVAPVRSRVCQGCHITLPRSAAPPAGDALTLCASCGRILYWA